MKHKTKIISIAVLSSLIAINTGYLIYEAVSTKENSLAYKLTHKTLPVNLKDNKVNEIKLDNLDGDYLIQDEPYSLNYTVYPLDAFDPSVTIKSSDPTKVEIKDDTFLVKDTSNEVTITITSNENEDIKKELKITPTYKELSTIKFDVSSNLIDESVNDITSYSVNQNEAFKLTFKGFNLNNEASNSKIEVDIPSSITRIGDSDYYYINDSYTSSSPCFIKGTSKGTSIEKTIIFSARAKEKPIPVTYKFFDNETEVSLNKLIKDKTYKVVAFDSKSNALENVPFIISNTNPLINVNYNLVTFKEANTYTLDLSLYGVNKSLNIKVEDIINSNFALKTIGDFKDNDENVITTYLNRGFRYEFDKKDTTISNFKITKVNDSNNIIEIKDNYIQAKKVGKVTIEVTPTLEAYKDYKKSYVVDVLPLERNFDINEIYIFGSIFLVTSILITLLLYFFLENKNSLYVLFTYPVGFVLVGVYELIALTSKIRYPSISIFFIYYLIYVLASTFTYIALHIYLMYKERAKKKEIK